MAMGQTQLMDVDELNAFFGPLAPGLHGVVFDEATADHIIGHIDVTPRLIAGTGFLFASGRHLPGRHALCRWMWPPHPSRP